MTRSTYKSTGRDTLIDTQRAMNSDIGVGFWTKREAELHARYRRARTGLEWVLAEESSPFGTRSLWFVRLASVGMAVA